MVLTGIDDKEWLLKALGAGADDFVHKLILREELELRLQGAQRLLRLEDQYKLLAEDLHQQHPELGLSRQIV
ncbi:MAG: hypothetical protein PHI97_20150 [Desulfobulbus sp.]|nr:hypothetical protein [Desulfobulbus sp.]